MLRRRKHGTTDRLALSHQHRLEGEIAETVRSAPGRDPRMPRVIRILTVKARERVPKRLLKGVSFPRRRTGSGLTLPAPAVSFGLTLALPAASRGIDDGSIHLSGPGLAGSRHGQGSGRRLSGGPGDF